MGIKSIVAKCKFKIYNFNYNFNLLMGFIFMLENISALLRCIQDIAYTCLACRMMDQMPNNNIGSACRGYTECIGNAFKNCFNAIGEKCISCYSTNQEAPAVDLAGVHHAEGEA
jgi:hypothetical protein